MIYIHREAHVNYLCPFDRFSSLGIACNRLLFVQGIHILNHMWTFLVFPFNYCTCERSKSRTVYGCMCMVVLVGTLLCQSGTFGH